MWVYYKNDINEQTNPSSLIYGVIKQLQLEIYR